MNVKKLILSVFILIFTSGCSGTYDAYYQTLQIAFGVQHDAGMTLVEVRQSEIDVISVKRGDRPTAIMALGYIENGQHKWVSQDSTMLIVDKGRLIRSIGLNENILYSSNSALDPLKLFPNQLEAEQQPKTWSRFIDRTGDEYGYPIESIFSQGQQENLQTLSLNIETTHFVEFVHYGANSKYIRLDNRWVNHFWYTREGVLIKSIEKISPLSESLEITYLSRIARLNQ